MSKWIYTELEFNIVQCSYPRYVRLHPIRLRFGNHWAMLLVYTGQSEGTVELYTAEWVPPGASFGIEAHPRGFGGLTTFFLRNAHLTAPRQWLGGEC